MEGPAPPILRLLTFLSNFKQRSQEKKDLTHNRAELPLPPQVLCYMLWTSKTHIISIWSWIGLSNHCHHARWQNFTVSSPKFPILPQGELSVCRFPVTLGGIVGLLRTNVTPSSYGQLQNLSIKAYSLEHHIWGYTSPLPTADVFLLIRHFSANATNTPSSRVISCSFWRQRVRI